MAEGLNQTRCSQRKGSWRMTLRRVSLLDTHWVQLGRGLKFSILNSHLGARIDANYPENPNKVLLPLQTVATFLRNPLKAFKWNSYNSHEDVREVCREMANNQYRLENRVRTEPNQYNISYWKNDLILYVGQIQDLSICELVFDWIGYT